MTVMDAVPAGEPSELGIDEEALAALVARAQADVDAGVVPSCQLAIARNGRVAATVTLGDATADSRYVIFSATKPIVASAVWILIGDGAIDVDATRRRVHPRVRDQRQRGHHRRAGDAPHVGISARSVRGIRMGRPRRAPRAVRFVAMQLGARHRVRVPPDFGALGARRVDRARER